MTVTTFPYEIARQKRLDDLIKRAFSHVWSRGLGRPVFGPAVSAAATVWWTNNGSIPAANVIMAFAPKGAASYATSKVNLANPGTYNASDGVAFPAWTSAAGWDFDSTLSQYLTTTLIPTFNQTWSMFCKFSGETASGTRILLGCSSGGSRFYLLTFAAGPIHSYANGGATGFVSPAGAATSGSMAFVGKACYLSGVADGTIATNTGLEGVAMYIGCRNSAGTAANFTDAIISSLAVYDTTLSEANLLGALSLAP